MPTLTKQNLQISPAVLLKSATIKTGAEPEDLSIIAELKIEASSPIIDAVREQFSHRSASFGSEHGLDRTSGGKETLQRLITILADKPNVTFPSGWESEVDVREEWPRREGFLTLKL